MKSLTIKNRGAFWAAFAIGLANAVPAIGNWPAHPAFSLVNGATAAIFFYLAGKEVKREAL